jgi:hypothetical protein
VPSGTPASGVLFTEDTMPAPAGRRKGSVLAVRGWRVTALDPGRWEFVVAEDRRGPWSVPASTR